ncbi:flippase-like domain-containing protein [Streptomyces adustus]|uniref:Flippase-like domain-containing protein n=1 Tax=Streptomyces adustus TaxID=1609272 RepID=A0A5N8VIV7_9ACTN|nr:lysylphosphatidylglycerol synthase transmembrane domain-containing protein [Streptomyces adustus]MPY34028.1 flippase-like domain-containing protein [Streptomyces adustus]
MTAETAGAVVPAAARPVLRTGAGRTTVPAAAAGSRTRAEVNGSEARHTADQADSAVRGEQPVRAEAAEGGERSVPADPVRAERAAAPAADADAPAVSAPAVSAKRSRAVLARFDSRALRTHLGTAVGVAILAVLLWRLGTGVFLDGLRRIDAITLLLSVVIGAVTTVFSAWRWALVARGLRIELPLGPAIADYYRALFLNAALPGGVLGDVHRAVHHGRSAGDIGRGVRAVVLERVAGQVALTVAGVTVLLALPSPVRDDARHLAPLVGLGLLGVLAVFAALRMNRAPAQSRRGRALRATLAEAREGLLSRRNGPGVALSSAVVLAGHLTMFVLAARVTGSGASVPVLLPLAVLALVAMGLPLNVGGFGPREGVTVWAFGAAGLGASNGLAVAVVYGVLSFVAALPGALVLVVRWYQGVRAGGTAPAETAAWTVVPDPAAGRVPDEHYRPSAAPESAPPSPDSVTSRPVSKEKYAPKESVRAASSAFPFSAEPRDGRPMTPESV